jgi:hypothetical protein
MQAGNDFSSDIGIDKGFRKFKMFSEDIQLPIASNKTDKRDGSLWDIVNLWQGELWGWKDGETVLFLDEL